MSASTDPRKGKPGQSCAECRRSVFYIFFLFPPAYSSDSERSGRNSNVTGGLLYFLGTRSTMNMGKETFPVSRVSEEVARLYVQMVSL
jgi:hypothetical protein